VDLKSYFFLGFFLLIGIGLRAEELSHQGSSSSGKAAQSASSALGATEARPEEASPASHKFEDLFIWKVSDELRLSESEEKKFGDFIHDMSRKKTLLNSEIQKMLEKLSIGEEANGTTKAQGASPLKKLNEYRNQIKKLNALNIEEIDQIKKILGAKKAVRYFVLKNELANQFKARLVNPDLDSDTAKSKTALPTPKLIEEE
jgi:hypothetical protein